jgi:hypothetical protein
MRFNRTKVDLIQSLSCLRFIGLILTVAAMSGCPSSPREFSQQDANLVMVGALSAEAQLAALAYSGYSTLAEGDLRTSGNDAAAYLKSATFSNELGQALISMLSKETPGDQDSRQKAWNGINSRLTDEARRVSPSMGLELYNFGLSLHSVSSFFAIGGPSGDLPAKQRLEMYRKFLTFPISQLLFTLGHKIPLPDKMATTLAVAEKIDLGNLEACEEFGKKLNLLERMMRAAALYGLGSLKTF